jgi:hypothetical protein
MNPLARCKQLVKQMRPLLEKHPDNAWLKKWVRGLDNTLAEVKKGGYSAEFEQFWKLYGARTGSKSEAYGVWCKEVEDPAVVIAAVKPYKADCKKLDQTLAHARTWLSQRRWESYEDVKAKAADMCQICKSLPVSGSIMVKYSDGGYKDKRVCGSCQKYSGLTVEEVLKRLHRTDERLEPVQQAELFHEGTSDTTATSDEAKGQGCVGSASPLNKTIKDLEKFRDANPARFGKTFKE